MVKEKTVKEKTVKENPFPGDRFMKQSVKHIPNSTVRQNVSFQSVLFSVAICNHTQCDTLSRFRPPYDVITLVYAHLQ